jgi:hypothetical protein
MNDDKAPPQLALARMAAVLGMAFTLTAGILLLVGGWLLAGGIALLTFLPFFGLVRLLSARTEDDAASALHGGAARGPLLPWERP